MDFGKPDGRSLLREILTRKPIKPCHSVFKDGIRPKRQLLLTGRHIHRFLGESFTKFRHTGGQRFLLLGWEPLEERCHRFLFCQSFSRRNREIQPLFRSRTEHGWCSVNKME